MAGSIVVYSGAVLLFISALLVIKPVRRLGIRTRRDALLLAAIGVILLVAGLMLPAGESRITAGSKRLDEFMPRWQFHEVHTIDIAAPPDRVFDAVKNVRADEIRLFRTLTWIRRGGRPLPPSILNASGGRSLLDIATHNGFVLLAEERPRDIVIGSVIIAPRGTRGTLTPLVFEKTLRPGFALAAMDFVVSPDGRGGSHLSTETRVFANDDSSRRRFAAYWRVIYPGSSLIRFEWLRAIEKRAMTGH